MLISEKRFEKVYQTPPQDIAFCPYRVCPIGAHVDHQLGKITGLAIDKGIHIAYRPKQNGVVEMVSLQFEKRAQWHVAAVPQGRQYDWADYLRGATVALSQRYPLHVGVCGVIEGSLPMRQARTSSRRCMRSCARPTVSMADGFRARASRAVAWRSLILLMSSRFLKR